MLLEHIKPLTSPDRTNRGERLYHKDIGFPEDVRMPPGFSPVVRLRYGSHAREEGMKDRYGVLNLPQSIDVRKVEVFEIGVTGNTVTKMAIRMSHDASKDLIIVFLPDNGFVKTVWANEKNDKHKTLNRARYIDPKREKQRLSA